VQRELRFKSMTLISIVRVAIYRKEQTYTVNINLICSGSKQPTFTPDYHRILEQLFTILDAISVNVGWDLEPTLYHDTSVSLVISNI